MLDNEAYAHAAAEALARRHAALRDATIRRDAKLREQQIEWRAKLLLAEAKFEDMRDKLAGVAEDATGRKVEALRQQYEVAQREFDLLGASRPNGHRIRNEYAAVVDTIDRAYHQELNALRSRLGFVPV